MNRQLYCDYLRWLRGEKVREDADEWRRQLIKTTARQFEAEGTILYKKSRNNRKTVVPAGQVNNIIRLAHDHPLAGHMGVNNTYYRLINNHWWPGMKEDIINHIRGCDTCQKRRRGRERAEADSAKIIAEPFSHIGIDVMGPLPRTLTGKRYIILAVDFFMKWAEGIAVEDADAQTITKFIHSDIICRHGVPKEITSDRGTEFLNELVEQMECTYHIKHIKTTAYHPQGNGLVERNNQTVKNILSKLSKKCDAWDHYFDSVLFAIRTIRQESTKFSPFELVYGQTPRREYHHTTKDMGTYEEKMWAYITRDITRLQLIRRKAKGFIDLAQERQRKRQNKETSAEKLNIGDEVLLFRNTVEASWSAKLEPKWDRPYRVQQTKGQSVWLRRQDGSIFNTAVHRNRLK